MIGDYETIVGKVIAAKAADTGENVAWIVGERFSPNMAEIAKIFARYNGRRVSVRIEEIEEEPRV